MATSFKLSMLLGATLGASVRRSFSETESKLKRVGAEIGSLKDKQKSIRSFAMNTDAVDKAKKSLFKARREVSALRLAWKNNKITNAEFGASIKKSEKSVGQLSSRLVVQQERLNKTRNSLKRAGISTNNLSQENERLGRSIDKLSGKYGRLKISEQAAARQQQIASRRSELRGQLFDTAATAFVIASPFRKAIEFEASVSKLRAITDKDTSAVTVEDLARQARDLGKDTPFTASQSIEAQTFLGMAGFGRDKIQTATPGILNLALASGEDVAKTADIASNIMSQFSMDASDMTDIGDALTAAFTSSNTTLESLGETLKFVGPVASVTGNELYEVLGMAAILGSGGIQAGEAGRALKQSVIRLAAPTPAGAAALNDLGIDRKKEDGDLKKIPELFVEITRALEGRSNTDVTKSVVDIFGIIASGAVLQIIDKTDSKDSAKILKNLDERKDRTQEVADIMTANTQNAIDRLGSAFENWKISFGTTLLPVIREVALALGSAFNGLAVVSDKFPEVTAVVAGAVLGLIALRLVVVASKFAFYVLVGNLGSLRKAYIVMTAASTYARINMIRMRVVTFLSATATKVLTRAQLFLKFSTSALAFSIGKVRAAYVFMTAASTLAQVSMIRLRAVSMLSAASTGVVTAAQWALNFAMTANPIGLVIVGIGTLIGIGIAVVKNWDKVSKFFTGMWERLKENTKTAIDWLLRNINLLLNPFALLEKIASKIGNLIFGDGNDIELVGGDAGTSKKIKKSAVIGAAMEESAEQSSSITTSAIENVSSAGTVSNTQNVRLEVPITINASPGMNSEDVAKKVKDMFQEEKYAMSRGRNSALIDFM